MASVVVAAACGASDEAPIVADAPLTVHVSTVGDDNADGFEHPVETLRRAIGIATENPEVTDIVIAAGSYSTALGERFPYTVPHGVRVSGPVGGGVSLVGNGLGDGLVLESAELHHVGLDGFSVAIRANVAAVIDDVAIMGSAVAVSGGAGAKLQITGLDVVGATTQPCPFGIHLEAGAQLMATQLRTQGIGVPLDAPSGASIDIAHAGFLANDVTGSCGRAVLVALGARSFALTDATIDGGVNGIQLSGQAANARSTGTITATTLRGVRGTGIDGRDGAWTLSQVTIASNPGNAVRVSGSGATAAARLTMRGCHIVGNGGDGVEVFDGATADLGTTASPGDNLIQSNAGVGVNIVGTTPLRAIVALGNTWNRGVQGSDANGQYVSAVTIGGPVAATPGNNFAIAEGATLAR